MKYGKLTPIFDAVFNKYHSIRLKGYVQEPRTRTQFISLLRAGLPNNTEDAEYYHKRLVSLAEIIVTALEEDIKDESQGRDSKVSKVGTSKCTRGFQEAVTTFYASIRDRDNQGK